MRLQGAHEAILEDTLHPQTHGRLQLQLRAVRQDVQGPVRLHDAHEGPRHGVLRVRHMRHVLSEQKLAVLSQALQAQDQGERVRMSGVQEALQDPEEPRQSRRAAQDEVRLRAVRHGIQVQIRSDEAPQNALRRKVVSLRHMRQDLRLSQLAEDPSADPRRRAALRLRHLRPELHPAVADDVASEETSRSASTATAHQDHQSSARCAG